MSKTQSEYIALNRKALGLDPGNADWAYHKLVSDKLYSAETDTGSGPDFGKVDRILSGPEACVLIGHTSGTGAYAFNGDEEWGWNRPVRDMTLANLEKMGVYAVSYERTEFSYNKAIREYAEFINDQPSIKATVELHFNSSSSEKSEGYEYIEDGRKGNALATCLSKTHGNTFQWQRARGGGVKKPFKGRGGALLNRIREAAVIAEPAFGSNPTEWGRFSKLREEYAESLALGIYNYLNEIR